MIKLSVVIITYNEERNIRRCLESVKDVADEIVVIDSYSEDNTENICKQYKVRFYQNRFDGYSIQKNYGIRKASYPYILSLDADEALSEKLKKSIFNIKNNWTHDAYSFNRLTNYCGKWIKFGGWYPDKKVRLWDSSKGLWGGMKVHEKVIFRTKVKIKHLKGNLLHYSYYSISDHADQGNKYSNVLAWAYYENGRNITFIELLIRSGWRFFRDYFIKMGFLSGMYGFVISVISSHEVFLKYVKLKKLLTRPFISSYKNVCFLNTNKVWGGGERWTLDTARYFRDRGYNVIIVSGKKSALYQRAIDHEFDVKEFKINQFSVLNYFKKKRFKRVLNAYNIGTLFLNLSNDFKFAAGIAKEVGVKKVIYRRAIPKPIRRRWYYKKLFKNSVDYIIANSFQTKEGILKNYRNIIDKTKIKVIYNGIPIGEEFKILQKESKTMVIGSAGRLSVEKGHMFLIRLAEKLKAEGLDFKILVAGEGKQRKILEKEIHKSGVADHVLLMGFLNDLTVFYQQIDVFVLPSIWEGFGFVLLEAMKYKLPIVAFDTGSSAEIIQDEKNGYIIPDFDLDKLTNCITNLYHNAELRKEMGEKGYSILKEKFTYSNMMNQVEELANC